MIPVNQTRTGWPWGNCLQASVASILEIPLLAAIDLPPNLFRMPLLEEFAEAYGYDLEFVKDAQTIRVPRGFTIASGRSDRNLLHACVYHDGILAHDPHPAKTGIHSVLRWYLFHPL